MAQTNYLLGYLSGLDDKPYYEALGRFITSYAEAEGAVHELARKVSGIKDSRARLIFGGMRLADVSSRLRQMLQERQQSRKYANVDACLTQLDVISKERDKFVHRYVSFDRRSLTVTNASTAKRPELVEVDRYTIPTLQAMDVDCAVITMRLILARDSSVRSHFRPSTLRAIKEPWRYKPQNTAVEGKRKKKSPQPPSRPPQSFRA